MATPHRPGYKNHIHTGIHTYKHNSRTSTTHTSLNNTTLTTLNPYQHPAVKSYPYTHQVLRLATHIHHLLSMNTPQQLTQVHTRLTDTHAEFPNSSHSHTASNHKKPPTSTNNLNDTQTHLTVYTHTAINKLNPHHSTDTPAYIMHQTSHCSPSRSTQHQNPQQDLYTTPLFLTFLASHNTFSTPLLIPFFSATLLLTAIPPYHN